MHRPALLLFSVLLTAVACDKSPTSPTPVNVHSCGGGTAVGSLSATIDGVTFVATCLDAVSFKNNIVSFGGTNVTANNLTTFIDIAIAVAATAPGTYQITAQGTSDASVSVGGSHLWVAGGFQGGSGTVVISAVSATAVSGTFSLNLVAGPGGTGTKTVTNGAFSITF